MKRSLTLQDRVRGALLGTAVGDAVGLPAEGLSRKQIEKRGWTNNWRHRLAFGHGMLSDDTDHSLLVSEAVSRHPDDVQAFRRCLAGKFRWWFLALPAGMGLATGRAIMKLWLGIASTRSGVFSAGNGPAMRSAIIGAYFADDARKLAEYVKASTIITHTDPKALAGALAVAWCAAKADDPEGVWRYLDALSEVEPENWPQLLAQMKDALHRKVSVDDFARELGLGNGVTGYVYHTVPVAIYTWMRHYGESEAFRKTTEAVFNCGGDVDTVGAIAGALAGASSGGRDIPEDWISGIRDWPRSVKELDKASAALVEGERYCGVFWPFVLVRNIVFLAIVLTHGFARLFPRRAVKKR